jgi:hypothetical protein
MIACAPDAAQRETVHRAQDTKSPHINPAPQPFDARPDCCDKRAVKNNTTGSRRMIYELRVYRCLPGRLPNLLKRFTDVTMDLFAKHGIRQAGFFTTEIGESHNELTYFLAWESMAEREKKWTAFITDPAWISARDASEKDGQIVQNIASQFLKPTSFSSVK